MNELKDSMLIDMAMYGRASRFVSVFAALIDRSALFLASLPCILPFALTILGLMSIQLAFYRSIGASFLVLFVLGIFLGTLCENRAVVAGLQIVVTEVFVA